MLFPLTESVHAIILTQRVLRLVHCMREGACDIAPNLRTASVGPDGKGSVATAHNAEADGHGTLLEHRWQRRG